MFGVKVQVLATSSGIPVQYCFASGSESGVQALKKQLIRVAEEIHIYADSAYTDHTIEDDLQVADAIALMVLHKRNSKRKDEPLIRFLKERICIGVKTTFSMLKVLFLKKNMP